MSIVHIAQWDRLPARDGQGVSSMSRGELWLFIVITGFNMKLQLIFL